MKTFKKTILMMTVVAVIASSAACGKSKAPSNATNPSGSKQTETAKASGSNQTEAAKASGSNQAEAAKTEAFPNFVGKDFDGNVVDQSLFAKNEATLLNFWFNGCSACVNEMPALEKFNAKLREKGAELIGVNVQAGESQEAFDEAKKILSKQGVTYRNIIMDDAQDARAYIAKIFSFPTTIIVDKNGNIVGQPILGNIEDEQKQEQILKVIDDLKSGKGSTDSIASEKNPEMDKVTELFAKENEIFAQHQDIWNKVFSKIQKDKVQANEKTPYPEFLKSQIEESKDLFTEDELKMLNDDLKEIEKIEKQIQELNQKG